MIEYKHAWLEYRKLHTFAPSVPCLFILMELANGGNLEEFIQVQLDPAKDAPFSSTVSESSSNKQRFYRTRRRTKSIAGLSLYAEKHAETSFSQNSISVDKHCLCHGGVGMGLRGVKVKFLRQQEILSLFLDIIRGINHLHQHSIIHRDVKPPNLLLHYDKPDKANGM